MRTAREMHLDVIRGHLRDLQRSGIDMADYIEGYLSYGVMAEADWNPALAKPSELMAMLCYFERSGA